MNDPKTAHKDETFLGHFGWPWWVMTRWNSASEKWCYACIQTGNYKGEWNDHYFEIEFEDESELKGWLPLPQFEPPVK